MWGPTVGGAVKACTKEESFGIWPRPDHAHSPSESGLVACARDATKKGGPPKRLEWTDTKKPRPDLRENTARPTHNWIFHPFTVWVVAVSAAQSHGDPEKRCAAATAAEPFWFVSFCGFSAEAGICMVLFLPLLRLSMGTHGMATERVVASLA